MRVYLDPSVLILRAQAEGDDRVAPVTNPGAAVAIERLRDAGLRPATTRSLPPSVLAQVGLDLPVVTPTASGPDADRGWLLTADPAGCRAGVGPGIRTILIGPRRPPTYAPRERCDGEARDLAAAVLDILLDEACA